MRIVSFTHSQVVLNLNEFLLLKIKIILKNVLIFILVLNTKEDIWRMWVTKQFMVPSDFHFFSIKVSGDQQLFGYQHSSKYILLCSAQE